MPSFLLAVCIVALVVERAHAVPPLVAGDVPTAEKGHFEWYVGTRYQKTDAAEWQTPFTELVYGLTERQELTFEVPYVLLGDGRGLGDAVLGTKFQFLRETERRVGIAGSFELKLANGNESRGLGSGALEYDFRLRAQKTFGWFTPLVNFGYTITDQRGVWFLAFAQEYKVTDKFKLLSEIYWRTVAESGEPNRFAADIGFKYNLLPRLQLHAAVGKSLREHDRGGPELRVYAGLKLEY